MTVNDGLLSSLAAVAATDETGDRIAPIFVGQDDYESFYSVFFANARVRMEPFSLDSPMGLRFEGHPVVWRRELNGKPPQLADPKDAS